jgi:ubiquinone/menaquinone biosynthesis C-methylase UbiE
LIFFIEKKIKNPSIIVFLLSGDIQLIKFKDNEFKCLSYNEKITLLRDIIQYLN